MSNELTFKNKTKKIFFYKKKLRRVFQNFVVHSNLNKGVKASLIIVDCNEMKKINFEYRKINRCTDVLSFPMDYEMMSNIVDHYPIGDIFINLKKIKEYSILNKRAFLEELIYTFIHGLSHLIGYVHNNDSSEKKMEKFINEVIK